MSDSEDIVVATKKGTPQNKKRKFNDVELQSPKGKKSKTSSPAVLTPAAGNTKKKNKQKGQTAQQNTEVVNKKSKSKKRNNVDENEENSDDGAVEAEVVQPQKKTRKNKGKKNKNKDTIVSSTTENADTSKDAERKDTRDSRTLFVKNLPANSSTKHIRALSKDVKQVRIRTTFSVVDKKRLRIVYAYVEFANEQLAEKNLKILGESYVKGNKLVVDYVGNKSSFITNKQKTEPEEADELRLYVTGFPESTTVNDVRQLFPKAADIVLPKRKKDNKAFGYAFVSFNSAELAKAVHNTSQDLSFKDSKLVVLYAKKKKEQSNKNQKKKEKKAAAALAKGKVEVEDETNGESPVKMEDDDEEEDDDDDDDEEEDDDDDDEEDDDDDE